MIIHIYPPQGIQVVACIYSFIKFQHSLSDNLAHQNNSDTAQTATV